MRGKNICILTLPPALGYEIDFLAEAGPLYFVSLWHKIDLKVFNERIPVETLHFLKQKKSAQSIDYSFSFNYRIRSQNGSYLTVLQRSTYFLDERNGTPLAAIGFILDITHFKEDTKIIFTIEKVDRKLSGLSKSPVFKAVYYPDKTNGVLSDENRKSCN